jgi:hypothetical protein
MRQVDQCAKGHPTPTAAYRDKSNTCLECKREYDEKHRLKRKAAYDVCQGLAAYGVSYMDGDKPVTPEELAAQLVRLYGDKIA